MDLDKLLKEHGVAIAIAAIVIVVILLCCFSDKLLHGRGGSHHLFGPTVTIRHCNSAEQNGGMSLDERLARRLEGVTIDQQLRSLEGMSCSEGITDDKLRSYMSEGFGGAGGLQTLAEQGYFQGSGHEGYAARKLEGYAARKFEGYAARKLEGMGAGGPVTFDQPLLGTNLRHDGYAARNITRGAARSVENYIPVEVANKESFSSSIVTREGACGGRQRTQDASLLRNTMSNVAKTEGFTENHPNDVSFNPDHTSYEHFGGKWGSPKMSENLTGTDTKLRDIAMY